MEHEPPTSAAWDETVDLPERQTWLLEASAGTGKTFQIAGIFARLVAEYGLPIERILAITFTEAATAELRARVRARLTRALDAVQAKEAPAGDLALARIVEAVPRDTAALRLELALRSFDLAAISTIHGFSHRMLRELAFDSGEEPELELLADTSDILREIVDDTFAKVVASVSSGELETLASLGFTRENLVLVAEQMTSATAPEVSPKDVGGFDDVRARVRDWATKTAALHAWWTSDEGTAALDALRQDVAGGVETGHLKLSEPTNLHVSIREYGQWLKDGALTPIDPRTEPRYLRIAPESLLKGAKDGELRAPVESRPWWRLLVAVYEHASGSRDFRDTVAPLAPFAREVRGRVDAELRRRRVLTFDGMLSRLAERLAATGDAESPLAQRIRARFDAALVDEFQDTDAAQWRVLRAAFHRGCRLFLIGDPKQAIYAFRGADVHVYLDAKTSVESSRQRTMRTNYRSDPGVVRAANTLFREGSRPFDSPGIDHVEITPNQKHPRLTAGAGLEIRWMDARLTGGKEGHPVKTKEERLAARLATREAVEWLEGRRGRIQEGDDAREVRPADLAVLVHTHAQGALVKRALSDRGIPAVAETRRSVFDSEPARWLVAWLRAIAGGGRDRSARVAAVTPLVGWTAVELATALAAADGTLPGVATTAGTTTASPKTADSTTAGPTTASSTAGGTAMGVEADGRDAVRSWVDWTARLAAAERHYARHGFARSFDHEADALGIFARVIALPDGERHATDLRHLFELVHAEERARRPSPAALAAWIIAQTEVGGDANAQRLESDAQAVKIATVHASKGLEYPIVLLPFAWAARTNVDNEGPFLVRGRREAIAMDGLASAPARSQAVLYVEPKGSGRREAARSEARDEDRREELRKTYVALTRAKHRTIVWYGPIGMAGGKASATAMGRLLLRNRDEIGFDDDAMPAFAKKGDKGWTNAQARLEKLASDSDGSIAWSAETRGRRPAPGGRDPGDAPSGTDPRESAGSEPSRAVTATKRDEELRAAPWPVQRATLESPWIVTSFSRISRTFDPDEKLVEDAPEPIEDDSSLARAASEPVDPPPTTDFETPPRLRLGRGKGYGTFVHRVLELLAFDTLMAFDGRGLEAMAREAATEAGMKADPTRELPRGTLQSPADEGASVVAAGDGERSVADSAAVGGGGQGPSGDEDVVDELVERLPAILSTPLDTGRTDPLRLPRGLCLRDIGPMDRLSELTFDLCLGRGTHFVERALHRDQALGLADPERAVAALGRARGRCHPGVDAWVDARLGDSQTPALFSRMAGILTGSIDLVFRSIEGRYHIVDYKTNRLGSLEPGDYADSSLGQEMAHADYFLQALLYTVALHRDLSARLRGYDYDAHVGGYLYLFLRGMAGPETPRDPASGRCLGVFGDRWPKDVVLAFDEALAPGALAP